MEKWPGEKYGKGNTAFISVFLEQTRIEIAAEKESALRDIRRLVARLSVQVSEKVLRADLDDDKKQDAYLDRLIDEVQRTQDKS